MGALPDPDRVTGLFEDMNVSKETMHTPGPWVAVFENEEPEPAVMAGKYYVAVACLGVDSGSSEANARLISAAPVLLEALETAVRLYESYWLIAGNGVVCGEWVNSARAAIAKAYGPEV